MSALVLKRNLVANVVGKGATGILGLLFIPIYIRFLGIDSYALLGLFATMTALSVVADFGLSATASRELSRLSVQPGNVQAMRDLVRTLEAANWVIAALLGAVITFGTPFILKGWIRPVGLPLETVQNAVLAMGLALALQWPVNFYANAIIGLQHQVVLNVINVGMAAIRGVGAALVLWVISPTIEAFFAWQIIVSACHVLLISRQLWRQMPSAPARARVHLGVMRQVWRFAMGMSGLMLITVLNTQTDKVVLSQSLTLSAFGYYSLAWVVAGYLTMLCEPVMLAFLPHMAQLVSLNDKTGLATAYRRAAQVMSVAVFPVTIFIALFAKEILGLWINDPLVTQNAGPLVSILICGSALEAVASVPLALQWAYGWTAPALWVRIGTLLLQIPAVYILSQRFGTTGGAVVWPVANAVILVAVSALIYRRLLLGKLRLWLGRDLLPPFAAALAVAGIWRALDVPQDSVTLVLFLAMAALSIFVAAALAVPVGMQTMIAALQRCIRLGQLALNRQHQSG